MGLLYGSVQKALLRQRTDEAWDGWLWASAFGGCVGINFTFLLISGYEIIPQVMPSMTDMVLLTLPFACLGLAQIFVLRGHVRGAWTWVLANVVGGLVLYWILTTGIFELGTTPFLRIITLIFVCAAPGMVTGFAMLWLLNFNWKQDYVD